MTVPEIPEEWSQDWHSASLLCLPTTRRLEPSISCVFTSDRWHPCLPSQGVYLVSSKAQRDHLQMSVEMRCSNVLSLQLVFSYHCGHKMSLIYISIVT